MIERPKTVRIATKKDEENIFDLLCSLYKENAMSSMDDKKVWGMIHKGTRDKMGIIGVIDGPEKIVATIALVPGQWWYSSDYHIEEYWNYVRPEDRKSSHAKDLINFGKWCSEKWGIPLLMGILSNTRTEAKIGLYSRQIKHVGALFVHDPRMAVK